ncbi:MAG: hypothetical protein ACRD1U_07610 [Vicinamibacterales bacterium]
MTIRGLLALGALLAALTTGAASARAAAQEASRTPITLAVMRSDGVMLPFAAFDGDDDWSTPWPVDIVGSRGPGEVPVNLAAIPEKWWGDAVPAEWRLWPRTAKAALILKPIAPAIVLVGFERRLGLRTDHTANFNPFVPPFELPYPKEGLAVGGSATVAPITSVSLLAPVVPLLAEQLREEIDKAEERTLAAVRQNTGWNHPFNREARRKIVPTIEAWYTTAVPDSTAKVSYLEIVKKYPPQPEDEGCGLETFVTGWVHQDAGEERPKTQFKALATYCDREKASYMLPFGEMHLQGRLYWIFQLSGRDHEWYAVAEIRRDRTRVVAEYYAGGVPLSLLQ